MELRTTYNQISLEQLEVLQDKGYFLFHVYDTTLEEAISDPAAIHVGASFEGLPSIVFHKSLGDARRT